MGLSVDLDDELRMVTREVGVVAADGNLPPEMQAKRLIVRSAVHIAASDGTMTFRKSRAR